MAWRARARNGQRRRRWSRGWLARLRIAWEVATARHSAETTSRLVHYAIGDEWYSLPRKCLAPLQRRPAPQQDSGCTRQVVTRRWRYKHKRSIRRRPTFTFSPAGRSGP
eukprot:3763768-Pleurochrysis_carterae.AAC.1